jgi:diadenosine tetraphosphate (Ap4A) HIT family hydrolase
MANTTQLKFGYPHTLIREYDHWCVLLRPLQPTLGSLVLVCKQEETAFSQISQSAFNELKSVTGDIETSLAAFRSFEKMNYLMLMMVDPDVHFHVLPRYSSPQTFEGVEFPDKGWPAAPELGANINLDKDLMSALLSQIKHVWSK